MSNKYKFRKMWLQMFFKKYETLFIWVGAFVIMIIVLIFFTPVAGQTHWI